MSGILALITDERVKQILDLLENPQENVTALCDGLLDSIRRQHGERLARIVGGFYGNMVNPHQFVSPATAAIMELALTSMSGEERFSSFNTIYMKSFCAVIKWISPSINSSTIETQLSH